MVSTKNKGHNNVNSEMHKKKYSGKIFDTPVLNFVADVLNKKGGEYHYTSPEGLKGILETRTFYFTDCQYLNDYRERIGINSQLDYFWEYYKKSYDKQFVKLLKGLRVDTFEDAEFSYTERPYIDDDVNAINRYFVFSTSHNGDNLSMWKYYSKGNGYNGFCIELFSYALIDEWFVEDTGAKICGGRVIYDTYEKLMLIKKNVDTLYNIWFDYAVSDEKDEKIIAEFRCWLSLISLFFKDECFMDEDEYRYVAIVPIDKLNDLSYEYKGINYKMYYFRLVNGVFVPYLKIPFNISNVDKCYSISAIRIGPSEGFEQKKLSLLRFIDSLDYSLDDCKICSSNIPLRY